MHDFERISAFMDGEVDAKEQDAVVRELLAEREACAAWARFHVIGDVLRQAPAVKFTMALAERVRSSLETEPTVVSWRTRRGKLLRPAAGLAIAASVAMIAIVAVQRNPAGPDTTGTSVAQEWQPASKAEPVAAVEPPNTPLPQTDSATQDGYLRDPRLNSYLVNFNEQRSSLGVPGIHPYVRIVGFEAE